MAADYGGIIAAIVSVLKADANLTAANASGTTNGGASLLAAFDPTGVTPARANSIFYADPPTAQPPTPCVVLDTRLIACADPLLQEEPTIYVSLPLPINVFGASDLIRPVAYQIDKALTRPWWGGAMDTADWQIKRIGSSGHWMQHNSGEVATDSNGVVVKQLVKAFVVVAASLNG